MGIRFNDNSITRIPATKLTGDLVLPIEGYQDGETHNTTVEDIRQFINPTGAATSVASSAIAAHTAAADPHPQYATDTDLSGAITAHKTATDPHPQYATDIDLSGALATHTAASDPHPQYATDTDLSGAIATHTAASDPHPQYATDTDLSGAIATHTAAADPHPQYATDTDLSGALVAHKAETNPHPQYATQNLTNLTDPVTARTQLGLGSAATRATGDFDSAGAGTTAANAAVTTHTAAANPHPQYASQNLANLTDPVTARTNLGLGSAAVRPITDFDLAGAGTAAANTAVTNHTAAANPHPQYATQNLTNLTDAAAARTNLGLGSAAVRPITDFDLAGAGTAAANTAVTNHTAAANPHPQYATQNLTNLTDAAAARTNLGLGSAAVRPTTDFDAAGAATAAVTTHSANQGNGAHLPTAGITDSQVSGISAIKVAVTTDATNNLAAGTVQSVLATQAQSIYQLNQIQLRNQFPQLIANGNFWVNQRSAASYSIGVNSGAHTLDRWYVGNALGTGTVTATQSSLAPTAAQSGILQNNSFSFKVAAAQASIAAAEYSGLTTKLEGYRFQLMAQRAFTVSFWVRSSVAGVYCLSARSGDVSQSFVAEYTINAVNTWEYKQVTFDATPAGGTWNYTNGLGLSLFWSMACGTNLQTAPGAWAAGNKLATNKQVNLFTALNNEFLITDVEIQTGYPTVIPTRVQDLVFNCYPYYQRFYVSAFDTATAGANQQIEEYFTLPYPMRTTPTLTLVAAGQRYNLSSTNAPVLSCITARDLRFAIYAAGNGYAYTIGELYELSADL